tara:strand:- start:332 stop:1660 length:1329 start_codon:yes stop_codon:yes gene_type:complete
MPVLVSKMSNLPLNGEIKVPGDKSMSHRALIIASLTTGQCLIKGLLESADVLRTAKALKKMGVNICGKDSNWKILGRGSGGLLEPDDVLDLGNSGTSARLLIGLIASHSIKAVITGDSSLRNRPMERVIIPAKKIGAQFNCNPDGKLPILIAGTADPLPIKYKLPVPSAQVKSAILIAGLQSPGKTTVIEPFPSRDHTEKMLQTFGAEITISETADGKEINLVGQTELIPTNINIPGDFSSAAFFIVAALLIPNSKIKLVNIGLNPFRTGLLDTLIEMGANIKIDNNHIEGNELVGDIIVKSSVLNGVEVPAERSPSMIDEFPILSIAASKAKGTTIFKNLNELKIKESNRMRSITEMLGSLGCKVIEKSDSLIIESNGGRIPGGYQVKTFGDHRIAMSALIAGMISEKPISIEENKIIETSFPNFIDLAKSHGANIDWKEK